MGLARSTFYDVAPVPLEPAELVARIGAICDEFECYGYRRVGAALRHQGVVVNSKKLRRLMREHDLQPKRRRRYVVTTDSDHAGPIFPDLAKDVVPERPNQLWVADLTYVAIPSGFVYLAAILDAWLRKVVGYAISRSMDARIAVAALKAAIRSRAPEKGCIRSMRRAGNHQVFAASFGPTTSRSHIAVTLRLGRRVPMSEPADHLTPADPSDLAEALAFALRFQGRKRVHNADELMLEVVATRLVEHLERAGFVVMKRAPLTGGAARTRI